MSRTRTIRRSERHETARKQLGATPTEFVKRALDAFCAKDTTQQDRLRKLRGSVRADSKASQKEGLKLRQEKVTTVDRAHFSVLRRFRSEKLPLLLPN
jgi:hypothetical protein